MKRTRDENSNVLKDVTASICKNKIYVLLLASFSVSSIVLESIVTYRFSLLGQKERFYI